MKKMSCVMMIMAAASLMTASVHALTVQVEPRSEECYIFECTKGDYVNVNVQVIRGGLLDINVKINGPESQIVEKLYFEDRDNGNFPFGAESDGLYTLCLDNQMSKFTAKVVTFSIQGSIDDRADSALSEFASSDALTEEDLEPIKETTKRIDSTLIELTSMQNNYRRRERVNRATAESTNSRVFWYSVLVSVVTVVVTVVQVFILQRWFPK